VTDTIQLITRYQNWIYGGLGVAALFYLWRVLAARGRLSRTPFGLEREAAFLQQNSAFAMLVLLFALAGSAYVITHTILPNINFFAPAGKATPASAVTATPVTGSSVVVDSSGCKAESVFLSKPGPHERIAGAFEVRGTAKIPDLAFYQLELSGAGTSGEWRTLDVGRQNPDPAIQQVWPVVNDVLGSFDSSLYPPGEYAFRLVALDAAGNSPPPCVVPVTIANVAAP
jgi:hypothetical protein